MSRRTNNANLTYDFYNKTLYVEWEDNENKKSGEMCWIIYARVSTEEQKRKGDWIWWQITDCKKRARINNVKIVCEPFIDEAVSWTKLDRKWFNAAMAYVEKENKFRHKIDYFICSSTSRFSRSKMMNENFELIWKLNALWVKLVAVWNWGIQEVETESWFISYSMNSMMDALESMRWKQRVRYWMVWKIMQWYWPFPDVPVWYKRISIKSEWKEIKILQLDEEKAPILAEWLRLFADGILLTKQQLYDFYKSRWLKSNSKKNKTWELHKSILDNILTPRKLFIYAWKLTYPDRWVTELIDAKHPAIIDLDIVDKIMRRLKEYPSHEYKKLAYDEDIAQYPLKRVLLCSECWRPVTKWKSQSWTWDYHHYYWCNTKWCKMFKIALPRDKVHDAVREKLLEITPTRELEPFFEHIFKEEWDIEQKGMIKTESVKKAEIKEIEKEMMWIENLLEKLTDPNLIRKKQEKRAELNHKKEELEYSLIDVTYDKNEYIKVYNDAKSALFNPVWLWDTWSAEIRQLLIRVCFNNKIYYTKNQGLRTPEISVLYRAFSQFSDEKTGNLEMARFALASKRHNP